MDRNSLIFLAIFGTLSIVAAYPYIIDEVGAYHIHTFFFEYKPSQVDEAISLRKELRRLINVGILEQCSLNVINVGPSGPFPVSMYEMCCNKTSFSAAYSFMAQNHGNLSVFIHPLTRFDKIDHTQRGAWMGQSVIMDMDCPCWFQLLESPKPCPVYPNYPDELPKKPENCADGKGDGSPYHYKSDVS